MPQITFIDCNCLLVFDTPFSTYIGSLTRYNVEAARFNGRGTYHRHDWQSRQPKYWSGRLAMRRV